MGLITSATWDLARLSWSPLLRGIFVPSTTWFTTWDLDRLRYVESLYLPLRGISIASATWDLAGGQGPRSVLVMDNASSHHNLDLVAMCYEADVLLAYLTPYSPGFNPIETSFSILKHWIRRHSRLITSYTKETGGFARFLYDAVGELADNVEHDSGTLFRLSGTQYP